MYLRYHLQNSDSHFHWDIILSLFVCFGSKFSFRLFIQYCRLVITKMESKNICTKSSSFVTEFIRFSRFYFLISLPDVYFIPRLSLFFLFVFFFFGFFVVVFSYKIRMLILVCEFSWQRPFIVVNGILTEWNVF